MSVKLAVKRLTEQLELIGIAPGTIRITTSVTLRKDGMPRLKTAACPDVAVWFYSKAGKRYCLTCAKWDTVRENLVAIYDTVKSLRTIELAGCFEIVNEMMRQLEVPEPKPKPRPEPKPDPFPRGDGSTGGNWKTYTDFGNMWADLQREHGFCPQSSQPPPQRPKPAPAPEPWWRMLGVMPEATPEHVDKMYAALSRRFHPMRKRRRVSRSSTTHTRNTRKRRGENERRDSTCNRGSAKKLV